VSIFFLRDICCFIKLLITVVDNDGQSNMRSSLNLTILVYVCTCNRYWDNDADLYWLVFSSKGGQPPPWRLISETSENNLHQFLTTLLEFKGRFAW